MTVDLSIYLRHREAARRAEGNIWRLPQPDRPLDDREPFHPDRATELELVPGHYKFMLDLPY